MLGALSSLTNAEPIEVPNFSFEERENFDAFAPGTDKYPQWALETWRQFDISANGGPLRIWHPGTPGVHDTDQGVLDVAFGGIVPEGNYVMLVRSRENDPARDFEAVTQLLDEPFDSTKSYTLTADVGRLPDASNGGSFNYTPDWFGYSVQFVVGGEEIDGSTFAGQVTGGTVLAEDLNSVDVPINQFITSTVTYTSNPADSIYDGLPIQIRLCALETPENREDDSLAGWVAFDNVTLQTGVSSPLAITAIEHSSLAQTVTLTWGSQEGQNYSVKSSRNLIDWDVDLAVSVASDPGASTTRTFPLSGLGNGTIFFRIEKN